MLDLNLQTHCLLCVELAAGADIEMRVHAVLHVLLMYIISSCLQETALLPAACIVYNETHQDY